MILEITSDYQPERVFEPVHIYSGFIAGDDVRAIEKANPEIGGAVYFNGWLYRRVA